MKKLLILGAGTGGAILANTLTRKLSSKNWKVTVIDKHFEHYYQPGFIFLPYRLYGYENRCDVTKPIRKPLPDEADFVQAEVKFIDYTVNKVKTTAGDFSYDWLILGMGCRVAPEEVEGMAEGMGKNVFTFYTIDGALQMQEVLANMNEGRFVVHISDMPIKCPVAPIEFMFLADYFFTKRGVRDKIEIELVTPLTGAFTKPMASKVLGDIAGKKGIKVTPTFDVERVDHENKTIHSFAGDTVNYDILATIPPNLGPEVIEESGLGDGTGYALTDKNTLKSTKTDNIYVVGDNTNVPTSKAGSVAHFEAEIIEDNILREIEGKEPLPDFDGHSNCFIESGFHKALLFDFNYDQQPVPGVFPAIGPFSLLKETRLNHWGKMAFKLVYWNLLLTGLLPGDPLLPAKMSFNGKDMEVAEEEAKLAVGK